jgi:flagellar biosynthesis protein FlhG
MAERDYYEVLEIEPSVSEEEVRRAYRRLKEIYAPDSLAIYGAYNSRELEKLSQEIDEAYSVLIDPEKRAVYDLKLRAGASAGVAAAEARTVRVALAPEEPPPTAADLEGLCGPDAIFTGDLLRKVRMARGLGLEELAERIKVKSSYLRALEDEEWDLLPASVYVRGFLLNLARELKLDGRRVLDTYFSRLKQYYRERQRD